MKPIRPSAGFTLVELMTVLGIVGLMSGVMGLALRGDDPARGLESAQATLTGLLNTARSQAALHQNRSMLVVDADPENDRFLRGVSVAVETAPNAGLWWLTDSGAVLPRGIYVVPGGGSLTGVAYGANGGVTGSWPEARRSFLVEMPAASVALGGENPAGKYLGMTAPLTVAGLPESGGDDKLVLAVGRRSPAGLVFEHPERVRGVALSSYGMAILINDPQDFDY